ncbi:MAG: hypothetical protein PHP45_08610 [Elusimicrobiales bacterium]|nr:hypothetical protein [Elusimicrobiales bacterium]
MEIKKRPAGVWIITIFYLGSLGLVSLSLLLVFSGVIPLVEARPSYFASLTAFDWIITAALACLGFAATISLFLLRRIAVMLFGIELGLNVLFTLFGDLTLRAKTFETPGLIGDALGLVILAAVFLYARNLEKKQILS